MPIRAQKSGEVHILGVIKLGEINRMIVSSGISDLFNNGRKLVLSFFILFFLPSVSLAATESFTGHGEYIMDNNDSIKHGQDIALREAIRNVAQQATVAMKSQSGTIDNHVYNDEVDMSFTGPKAPLIIRENGSEFLTLILPVALTSTGGAA